MYPQHSSPPSDKRPALFTVCFNGCNQVVQLPACDFLMEARAAGRQVLATRCSGCGRAWTEESLKQLRRVIVAFCQKPAEQRYDVSFPMLIVDAPGRKPGARV
ncbi:MAG TPA: hypothetical protein VF678_13125 [bacterium]